MTAQEKAKKVAEYKRMGFIICHFDGATQPTNPDGHMGVGAVIELPDGKKHEYSHHIPARKGNTNNIAEYMGFTWILQKLLFLGLHERPKVIFGDSMMVVMQMNRKWKIKEGGYVEYANECLAFVKDFKNTQVVWIPRELNTEADALSTKKIKQFMNQKIYSKPKNKKHGIHGSRKVQGFKGKHIGFRK